MSAFAATDVTYTITKRRKLEDGRSIVQATLAFGNSTLTYPSGGIPITIGKLGCPTYVDSFVVEDDGISAYSFSYDKTNKKLVMFSLSAHTHDLLLKDGTQADDATTRLNASTNKLGANSGGNITVAGGGANGGVVLTTTTQAPKAQLGSTAAPAAQTLKVTVIGA